MTEEKAPGAPFNPNGEQPASPIGDGGSTTSEATTVSPMSRAFDLVWNGKHPQDETSFKELFIELAKTTFAPLLESYTILFLWSTASIQGRYRDAIFQGLKANLADGAPKRPVLLYLNSPGGEIEPAYFISKVCHELSNGKFIVCVPREAKSAATLIALGADEVHMGYLSELGPIDPQIGGRPALGIIRSLEVLARIVAEQPGSSDLYAKYLTETLSLSNVGWFERLAESAEQYAQKLLKLKHSTISLFGDDEAQAIARKFVHEYKDHSFVIDVNEARSIFSNRLIVPHSPELQICEEFYEGASILETAVKHRWGRRLAFVGDLDASNVTLVKPPKLPNQ